MEILTVLLADIDQEDQEDMEDYGGKFNLYIKYIIYISLYMENQTIIMAVVGIMLLIAIVIYFNNQPTQKIIQQAPTQQAPTQQATTQPTTVLPPPHIPIIETPFIDNSTLSVTPYPSTILSAQEQQKL